MLALKKLSTVRGFTLVELLVVISIIGILSSIGIVSYSTILKNSRDARRQSDIKGIQSALEQYRADNNFYPTSLNLSTSVTLNSSSGNPNPPASSKVYLNNTPTEPSLNSSYPYLYSAKPDGCNNTTNRCTSYCLYAKLETAISKASQCSDKPVTCSSNNSNCYTLKATLP